MERLQLTHKRYCGFVKVSWYGSNIEITCNAFDFTVLNYSFESIKNRVCAHNCSFYTITIYPISKSVNIVIGIILVVLRL